MKIFSRSLITAFFMSLLLTSAAYASGSSEDDGNLTVLATTSMVGDIAQSVAGDIIDIEVLIVRGKDPHDYEPTPRDMAKVDQADILFTNGFDLEENLLETLENVTTGRIVEVSSAITPIEGDEVVHDHEGEEHNDDDHEEHEGEEHDDHAQDPHTWTSPLNIMKWVEVIKDTLIELDPENANGYEKNAESYLEKLLKLDKMARSAFDEIHEEDKLLVTDHSVFGYFARDYGFENLGAIIPTFTSSDETSAKELTHLIDEVNEHQIKAVFIGNTAGNAMEKLGNVLVDEADHPIQLLEIMTGSLSAPGQEGDNYLDYFQYNVNQIVKGLGSED